MDASPLQSADAIVLGGGPVGCTLATLLARSGWDVLLVERNPVTIPTVGESLLPFGNRVLEIMGISLAGFLRKDAAVFFQDGRSVRFPFNQATRTPWDHAHQVPRADFDQRFRQKATEAGVRWHYATVTGIDLPGQVHTSRGSCRAPWILDCLGRGQFVARKLGIRSVHPKLRNLALARPHRGVRHLEPSSGGDVSVCIFPGGWWWFIPFADGTTSVGVVLTPAFKAVGDRWAAALAVSPEAQRFLQDAEPLEPQIGVQDFSGQASDYHGDGWALVGDAACFIDPVFSSGIILGLEAAERLSRVLTEKAGEPSALNAWEQHLRKATKAFEASVIAFYDGTFMEAAFCPEELQREDYRRGIISLLAGDLFEPGNPLPHAIAPRFGTLAKMVAALERRQAKRA
jgi:flavin-dependent dehydrogenase